jgi:hypothetical protein
VEIIAKEAAGPFRRPESWKCLCVFDALFNVIFYRKRASSSGGFESGKGKFFGKNPRYPIARQLLFIDKRRYGGKNHRGLGREICSR